MTNICLIDDDQNILASLSLTLKSEGYNIKTFSDGLSGLTSLQKDNYDIAILDIKMPRLDGLEVLQELRQTSNLPVIFELEGVSALEEMPDMNMRMNAISNCESYLIEAGKDSEVINNLLRYLFEVVLMPPSMQADINDRPVGASEPPNDSPQNSVEGGESVQGSGEINWWDSESVNAQLEMSNTEVCNEYGCITIRTKADRWPDGLIEAEYGISHSSYIGYIDREIKPDKIVPIIFLEK